MAEVTNMTKINGGSRMVQAMFHDTGQAAMI